jgi:hypothetical protein
MHLAGIGVPVVTTYKVTGATSYLGHEPGETFEADLDPEQERRALERGSIKKTTAKAKNEEEAKDDA